MRPLRLAALAARISAAARLKFLLLTTLIAVASLVFLGVQELSRASSSNLDDAVARDLGAAGTYRIDPSPELGLERATLLRLVSEAIAPLRPVAVQAAEVLPAVRPTCPPYDQIGERTLGVLLDPDGSPAPFEPAALGDTGFDLCLAGLVIPRGALREATAAEQRMLSVQLVVDPAYAAAVRLSSTAPARRQVGVITGAEADQADAIRERLRAVFAEPAELAGIDVDVALSVTRTDDGDQVRVASQGIKLVYALIGWGVLLVSGLGLLSAELIVLRDRTWFFGLSRAVGARRADIAALIVIDILTVLLTGLAVALLIAGLTAPFVESFGAAAFHAELRLARPDGVATLGIGATLMLVLGSAYPAWRAMRLDPLDVLERR
ncbi:MAG TPA: ABC transporter permease [Arachnia sp.]|nr:ABC transporter permease [Arachnia sp.]